MSLLRVVPPLVSLFLFSAFAQISWPDCPLATWDWTFNSAGQNPCEVLAYMMATCDQGSYVVGPLPQGYSYSGPTGSSDSDLCDCSTVGYSLFSACDACQGQTWFTWSVWVTNCTRILPPSSFPNPVPSGILVPQWALLDVTNENSWDPNKSYAVGDTPELGPGSILGPSGVSLSQTSSSTAYPSSTASTTSMAPPPSASASRGSNPGVAAIAGGIAGFVVAVSIAVAVLFLYRRRRRSQAALAMSAGVSASQPHMDETPRALSDEGTIAPSSLSGSPVKMRLYDPNDPTTFPGYQGDPHSMDIPSQVTMSSNVGTGNVPNTQTSLSLSRGYHGLPTV